ncbi:nucleoside triphosphate pyrophosphatase [Methylophaga sp.]|jgi:MAF protein|uniref:Maf family protein n=1 Tax=Methylophaga sp. TaxID=2024840 RepID=UPI0013FFC3D1|nr:nucleoside triphosphate pyrophosphatase [Methylophaga sp.]MTI64741.1 septum formation inhibitor Maf [Methylophaga sp.]
MQQLILGSSSPFRAELLNKLGLTFIQVSPDIDETPRSAESPAALVERLAESKAREIARTHPEALIIGSDQVAVIDNDILGKPGNHQNAMAQLRRASGREVTFLTGLALLNAKTGRIQSSVEPFTVHFRDLTDNQIDFYLKKEQPYQCAGSFKSEGFGISLFSKLDGDDPNTLIGLPLIRLIEMLQHEAIDVLQVNH